jgi:hypothetical protein
MAGGEMKELKLDVAKKAEADVLAPYVETSPASTRGAFTQVPDWVILCERVNATAFRLWCVLRSMQFERGPGIPPMTLDEVCWLLPGVNGKPTSRARARESLDSLLAEGLLKDVTGEGVSKSAPRVYLAMDEPQKAMGWTNARRKLRRYSRLWRKG